jgi:hypothetical protein
LFDAKLRAYVGCESFLKKQEKICQKNLQNVYIHSTEIHAKETCENRMSDFFSNLYGGGIRKPDAVINPSGGGALPPMSTSGPGFPAGFNGAPDGRINTASTLLGDVSPYSYAEADRLSTQAAYLNIPHRVQRIVPSLQLPEAQPYLQGGKQFTLSHQLDDGDIGFVVRAMFSPYEMVHNRKKYDRQGILFAVDPIINLATVNYILHGLQRYGFMKEEVEWNRLWIGLGLDDLKFEHSGRTNLLKEIMVQTQNHIDGGTTKMAYNGESVTIPSETMQACRFFLADHIIKNIIRPFGIPLGSEKQGGQHQGSSSAVSNPVDFVTTLTIDGLVINLVNIWRGHDISSGDDLMLYLKECSFTEYVLSHHAKNNRMQRFPPLKKWSRGAVAHATQDFAENAGSQTYSEYTAMDYPASGQPERYSYKWDHSNKNRGGQLRRTGDEDIEMEYEGWGGSTSSTVPKSSTKEEKETDETIFQLFPGTSAYNSEKDPTVESAIWNTGYWHIARSQVPYPCIICFFAMLRP